MSRKIGVCSAGNPLASSTWSGTPARICGELTRAGRLGATLDSSAYAPRRVQQLIQRLSSLYYRGPVDTSRGRLERYLSARYTTAFFAAANATEVLHTGSSDLPVRTTRSAMRHYLFCDSTWDLWRRGSSSVRFCSDRLIADAERLEQVSFRQMAHIFPTSEYVRRNLMSHYGIPSERITVVGTGRGAIQPYAGPKDYANGTVLLVAKERFEDKGGSLLIEGFRRALQRNSQLRLILVGDERYRDLVAGVPNVEVHGYVPLEQLQGFFNRASLFAMPAVNEPWGLVFLEALSCRTPVMGLNRNALPELTQDGRFGFCLDQATPEGVAEGLLDALGDPGRLARMGAGGQECALAFTWERTARRILDAIDRCE